MQLFKKYVFFFSLISNPNFLPALKKKFFKKLQAAYSNLSDPLSRAKYDNSLNVLDLDFDMASESSPPPSSTRSDFSDDDDDDGDIETPAPPPTPGPESFEAKYFNQNNNNDDDNGQEWHTKAWLEDAIRESIRKIIEYNKRMGVLAAAAATAVGEEEEKGEEENCPIEWDELRGKMWREMRYQEMLRRDLK